MTSGVLAGIQLWKLNCLSSDCDQFVFWNIVQSVYYELDLFFIDSKSCNARSWAQLISEEIKIRERHGMAIVQKFLNWHWSQYAGIQEGSIVVVLVLVIFRNFVSRWGAALLWSDHCQQGPSQITDSDNRGDDRIFRSRNSDQKLN